MTQVWIKTDDKSCQNMSLKTCLVSLKINVDNKIITVTKLWKCKS